MQEAELSDDQIFCRLALPSLDDFCLRFVLGLIFGEDARPRDGRGERSGTLFLRTTISSDIGDNGRWEDFLVLESGLAPTAALLAADGCGAEIDSSDCSPSMIHGSCSTDE